MAPSQPVRKSETVPKVTWPSGCRHHPRPKAKAGRLSWNCLVSVSPDEDCPCQQGERPPGILESRGMLQPYHLPAMGSLLNL